MSFDFDTTVDREYSKITKRYNNFCTLDTDVSTSSMQQTFVIMWIYTVNEILIEKLFEILIKEHFNTFIDRNYAKREEIKLDKILQKNDSWDIHALWKLFEDIFGRNLKSNLSQSLKDDVEYAQFTKILNLISQARNSKAHNSLNYFEHNYAGFNYIEIPLYISILNIWFKKVNSYIRSICWWPSQNC